MQREYPERPLVGIGAVVRRGNRVLLLRRAKPPRANAWSLPGGLQRLGETVFAAAAREVREETGVIAQGWRLIAIADLIEHDDAGRVRYHYTLIDVAATWCSGDAVAGDDASAVAWADLDDLARYELWEETVRVIRLAFANGGTDARSGAA
jgi:ADP-ribose pyrophosphatase YjhB (NUDIX family)